MKEELRLEDAEFIQLHHVAGDVFHYKSRFRMTEGVFLCWGVVDFVTGPWLFRDGWDDSELELFRVILRRYRMSTSNGIVRTGNRSLVSSASVVS